MRNLPWALFFASVALSLLVAPSFGAPKGEEKAEAIRKANETADAIRKAGGEVLSYDWSGESGYDVWFTNRGKPGAVAVSDEALRRLKVLPGVGGTLRFVNVSLTDSQMKYLAGLSQLQALEISNTKVTDAGLMHIRDLKNLTDLRLQTREHGQITDKGIEYLGGLTHLTELVVWSPDVSDSGLKYLKALTKLESLRLDSTRVTGAGLEHLKGATGLTRLDLAYTRASDAGLESLKWFPHLKMLVVGSPDVTDAGLRHLKGLTELVSLGLDGCTRVTGAGLEHLKGAKRLTQLGLDRTGANDAGLESLKWCPHLVGLVVGSPDVTDAGLRPVGQLTKLAGLILQCPKVTDAGVRYLKGLTALDNLTLQCPQVTDAGLRHLKGLTAITDLDLRGTQVTDAGLESLVGMPHLEGLDLKGTRVTEAGVAKVHHVRRVVDAEGNVHWGPPWPPTGIETPSGPPSESAHWSESDFLPMLTGTLIRPTSEAANFDFVAPYCFEYPRGAYTGATKPRRATEEPFPTDAEAVAAARAWIKAHFGELPRYTTLDVKRIDHSSSGRPKPAFDWDQGHTILLREKYRGIPVAGSALIYITGRTQFRASVTLRTFSPVPGSAKRVVDKETAVKAWRTKLEKRGADAAALAEFDKNAKPRLVYIGSPKSNPPDSKSDVLAPTWAIDPDERMLVDGHDGAAWLND
jgi:Leucine-rich repeat (LRR) protein